MEGFGLAVVFHGSDDGIGVESAVFEEVSILARRKCKRYARSDAVHGHPVVPDDEGGVVGLDVTNDHEGCVEHGNKAEEKHSADGEDEKDDEYFKEEEYEFSDDGFLVEAGHDCACYDFRHTKIGHFTICCTHTGEEVRADWTLRKGRCNRGYKKNRACW